MWDRLFVDVALAAMTDGASYGAVEDGALAVKDGRIAFAGPRSALPGPHAALAASVESLPGRWITPALVDCHTHLVFAGDRSGEFERRLAGATYAEIARAGGGIMATVRATRAATCDELVAASRPRLDALIEGGVATVEIKSGYGLTVADEIKMLEAASRLAADSGVRVRRTLLAMHALPPEFASDRDGYVSLVCDELLPEARRRGLVDAVDAYCETIGFTPAEVERLFDAADALGVPVKLHAEQLSDLGGTGLAARRRALSADHLEYANEGDIAEMARSGTVAVLLPGAFYALREKTPPPVAALRRHGVPMAVATDCNPGTSPMTGPALAMNMASTLFGLTAGESLSGMTRRGAEALGLSGETGQLSPGLSADLAIWRISRPAEIVYWIGAARPERVLRGGREIARAQ